MGKVFKIFLGIFFILVVTMIMSLYFHKPKKPEIVEIPPLNSTRNSEILPEIKVEKLQVPTIPKPLTPYEESTITTSSITTTSKSTEFSQTSTEELPLIIEITAKEFEFIPKEIKVKAKTPVLIIFKNEGNIPFDLKISNEDFKIKFDLLSPKQESKLEVEFPKPGIYEFFSTVPIGIEKNMKGIIIAE